MRYYLLRQDARPDHWQAVFIEGIGIDALRAGLPMDAPAAPARVTVSPLGPEPSDFLELPCPFVSDAMRRALDAAGVDNVEYFPAQVVRQYDEDEVLAHYWAANVVGAVACAAPPADATAAADADDARPSFRVDPRRARGFGLFRLAEDRRLLIVSEAVADALRAAGLRGLVLQAPEAFTGRRVNTAPPAPDSGAP